MQSETMISTPKLDLKKNSKFLHLMEKDNTFCLLHSLTLRKIYGGTILKDLYNNFNEPCSIEAVINLLSHEYPEEVLWTAIADLEKKGLIVKDEREDLKNFLILFERGMGQYRVQHMYFIPTTDCNLRCKYCFIEDEDRDFKPKYMSLDTAKKGLELFAKLTENISNISICFYGGEPLLNSEVLYFSMRYVRALEEKGAFTSPVDMSLITNGTLVDDKTIEVLLETKTKVSISLDGDRCFHDSVRVTVRGEGSFDKALEGYKKLHQGGAEPGISCTLCKYNVEHIEAIAKFFAKELKPSGMGFNILIPRLGSESPVAASDEYAADQLISAFKILREEGIYEDRVMRRVRPYINLTAHLKDCMGVGGQIVISPEGKIGPCQAFLGLDEYFPLSVEELYSRLPSITSEGIYADPLFKEWCHRFPLNMKDCMNCFAIAICGGGCPYAALVTEGSIWKVDKRVCFQAKKIMEWMIWDTFDQSFNTTEKIVPLQKET